MYFSDDNRFVYFRKYAGFSEKIRLKQEEGFFVLKLNKFTSIKYMGFLSLEKFESFYYFQSTYNRIGVLVFDNKKYKYNEYNLINGNIEYSQTIDYFPKNYRIEAIYSKNKNTIAIFSEYSKGELRYLISSKRDVKFGLIGEWEIFLPLSDNDKYYIIENRIIFRENKFSDVLSFDLKNGFSKRIDYPLDFYDYQNRVKGKIFPLIRSDANFNYVYIVQPELM